MPEADDEFAALWDAHYDDVLGYAARRVDHETARDLAAETFLIAWRRRADIPMDRPFPWLLHVAMNVLANAARGHRRRDRLWWRMRDDRGLNEPVADVATGVVEDGRIGTALRRLSPRDREVLQLIGWEELDVNDAAVVVGCSAKTFSVRLHRARRRLSDVLAELDAEGQSRPIPNLQRSSQS